MIKIQQDNSFSGEMVKYYDAFFDVENKAFEQVDYMKTVLHENWNNIKSILDIGCGTGKHAEILAKEGKRVVGIDLSEDMIRYSKDNRLKNAATYIVRDICTDCSDDEKFDLAYAMSHVIGYQLNNKSLKNMINNVYSTLNKGGVFFFNFYHESGLYLGGLSSKRAEISKELINIKRFSNAKICAMENALELEYDYLIDDRKDNKLIEISIQEKMRFFSYLELKHYLEETGFRVEKLFKFGTQNPLDAYDWNGCIVAVKCD